MLRLRHAVLIAPMAVIGCDLLGPRETTAVTVCLGQNLSLSELSWVAYQSGAEYASRAGRWIRVHVDEGGAFTVRPRGKVGLAFGTVFQSRGTHRATTVLYLDAHEVSALQCQTPPSSSPFTISIMNIPESSFVLLGGPPGFRVTSGDITSSGTLTVVAPREPFDLVATARVPLQTALQRRRTRSIIVRRGLGTSAALETLDFAQEGAPPEMLTVSTNALEDGVSNLDLYLETGRGTLATLDYFSDYLTDAPSSSPFEMFGAPAGAAQPDDRYVLRATSLHGLTFREAHTRVPITTRASVMLGPQLPEVTRMRTPVQTSEGTMYRHTVSLPSQPEYGSLAQALFQWSDASGSASYRVLVTRGYLGGTPAAWMLATPEFEGLSLPNVLLPETVSLTVEAWDAPFAASYANPCWSFSSPVPTVDGTVACARAHHP